ncbi:MAG: hypothetical protein VR65_06710 [Desulfobulbaceae bacterium BRH_c16a]|nr:MAG: hypothetical protein VR65_06710 [Desulfobulbaceae bacterium BRH_c16a]
MTLRDKLLREALRQFSTKGYSCTSTSSIIEAVGASKGGLYNHFRNKEELFLEALSLARKIWREKNLHGLDKISRPTDKIIRLLENYRDFYLTDTENLPGGCMFVNLAVELSDEFPHLGKEVNEGFFRLRRMIKRLLDTEMAAGTISKDQDTDEAAEILFAGILGACVVYSSDKSRINLDRSIGALCGYVKKMTIANDTSAGPAGIELATSSKKENS